VQKQEGLAIILASTQHHKRENIKGKHKWKNKIESKERVEHRGGK
jgi:hypothetical protein